MSFLRRSFLSARTLFRRPGLTLVVVATLAVGIGANTAIFSLVHGVLLQPLPYDGAERLVTVWEDHSARGGPEDEWTGYSTFQDWRDDATVFEALAAYSGWAPTLAATDDRDPERLTGLAVTARWFDVLAADFAQGRGFLAAEDLPDAESVVVVSHSFWQRHLGADPEAVGRALRLDGAGGGGGPDGTSTVVGVLPEGFEPLLPGVEIWRPLALDPARDDRGAYFIQVIGRLLPGVSPQRAALDMDRVAGLVAERAPAHYEDVGVTLIPLHERLVGAARPALLALGGAVALLLLVACANVAGLQLVHAVSRRQELAVRAGLGAGRWQLVRQLVSESLLLSVVGGGAGLLLAVWGTRLLVAMAPPGTPRIEQVATSGTAVAFAFGLSLLTGLAFGLVPAVRASRVELAEVLRPGGRVDSAGQARLRASLVVAETALALCLLLGAGLLAKSFWGLTRVDLGFDAGGVVTTAVNVPRTRYQEPQQRVDFYDRLTEALAARPDVAEVAAASNLPMGGAGSDFSYYVEGTEPPPEGREPAAWYRLVTPGYFDVLGIRRLAGRGFEAGDDLDAPRVIAVSERFARRWFGDESALGRRLKLGSHESERDWMTIVAVVSDVRDRSPMLPSRDDVYLPSRQYGPGAMQLLVRGRAATESVLPSVLPALREELRRLDPSLPMSQPVLLEENVSSSLWLPRLSSQVVSVFAAVALGLAALGIYGMLAHAVHSRRRELGVRAALGADRGRLVADVLRHGLRLAAFGLVLGLGLSALLAGALRSALGDLLHGVGPTDPAVLAATTLLVLAGAALASWLPARRAARTDPAACLREE